MFKRSHRVACALAAFALALPIAGCEESFWRDPGADGAGGWNASQNGAGSLGPLRIASFNIQSFGPKKVADRDTMQIIVDVIRRFDVVAVQEIRSIDQTVVERLMAAINANGRQYDYVLSPRLGRGSYQEQYAFIYDTQTMLIDRSSVYTILDDQDYFHREPMVATFQTRVPPGAAPFTFTLINIHTDPDDVVAELSVLDDVVRGVAGMSVEDDVILIGDLNASPQQFGPLLELPNVHWALSQGQWTNTRRSNSYDNLVFNRATTVEFTGNAGVIDLRAEYGLNLEQALRVSDHLPVWAEFYPTEDAQQLRVATPPRQRR